MHTIFRILFIIVVQYTISTKLCAQEITLEPQNTMIVTSQKEAILKAGANFLQKQLRKIYQTENGFNIVFDEQIIKKPVDVKKYVIISLGPTFYANQQNLSYKKLYSFNIKKQGSLISIVGNHPIGSIRGMAYFLDKYCDIRYYMPSDLFVSLSKLKKIVLPDTISITQEPFVDHVMGTGLSNSVANETFWATYNGLQRKNWESHQHSMHLRFPPEQFKEKYPEIYPLVKGQRYFPVGTNDQKWQPDFSEPKLVDAAVESAIAYFKQKQGVDYISFSVQDSQNYPVEGKMAEILKRFSNSQEGRMSAYTETYVQFLNQVAKRLEKELPENGITDAKTIVFISYNLVKQIPKDKLHPNILPILVSPISELDKDGITQKANWKNPLRISDWAKITNRIGHHDRAQGSGHLYPRIYSDMYSKYLNHINDLGLKMEYMHVEMYPNWGLDGPKYYVMGKLFWSPNEDIKSLMNQFCDDMFGKASKPMYKYFDTLLELTYSMENTEGIYRKLFQFPKQLFLNEKELNLVKQARKWLDQAKRRTKDETARKRIEFFSKSFRLTEYLFELANAKEVKQEQIDEVKKYLETVILPDKMTFYSARNKGELEKIVTSALTSIPNMPKPKK